MASYTFADDFASFYLLLPETGIAGCLLKTNVPFPFWNNPGVVPEELGLF